MQHFHSLDELILERAWATIGTFDGVHRGHQQVIHRLVEGAHADDASAVVVTFDPHPAVVLRGLTGPFALTSPTEKAALLAALGVDVVVTLRFDHELAGLSAEDFMRRLCARLGLRRLLAGYDFALGRGRAGTVPALKRIGEYLGYQVETLPAVKTEDEAISSSRIRALLAKGDVTAAAALLGRPYSVSGPVTHGDGRGHGLGIPTANISTPADRVVPTTGVYATRTIIHGARHASVTNIGVRPTFENEPVLSRIETHLLDFDQDLYGQTLALEFIRRLRDEQRFETIEALLAQIHQDIQDAREVLHDAP